MRQQLRCVVLGGRICVHVFVSRSLGSATQWQWLPLQLSLFVIAAELNFFSSSLQTVDPFAVHGLMKPGGDAKRAVAPLLQHSIVIALPAACAHQPSKTCTRRYSCVRVRIARSARKSAGVRRLEACSTGHRRIMLQLLWVHVRALTACAVLGGWRRGKGEGKKP